MEHHVFHVPIEVPTTRDELSSVSRRRGSTDHHRCTSTLTSRLETNNYDCSVICEYLRRRLGRN